MAILLKILMVFLLVGWVIPLWVGIDQVLTELIANYKQRVDSFPHLQFAKTMFAVATVWLVVSASTSAWMALTFLRQMQASSLTK